MSTRRRSVAEITFLSTPGLLYGFLLAIAIGLSGLALAQVSNAMRLNAHGVTTLARVVRRESSTYSCGTRKSRRTCHDYDITYAFRTAAGERRVSRDVGRSEYDRTRMGETRSLRYLPEDPSVTEGAPGEAMGRAMMAGGIAIVVAGAGLVGLGGQYGRATRLARVRDRGVVRTATVTAHRDTGFTVNGAALLVLQWRDDTGATGEGMARFASGLPSTGT